MFTLVILITRKYVPIFTIQIQGRLDKPIHTPLSLVKQSLPLGIACSTDSCSQIFIGC